MNDRALLGAMFVAGVSTAVVGGLAVTELGRPPAVRPTVERSAPIGPRHAPPSIALQETPPAATVMQGLVGRPVTEAPSSVPLAQAPASAPAMQALALPPTQTPVSRPITKTSSPVPALPAPVDSSITVAAAIAPLTQTPASPPAAQSPSSALSTPTPLHQAVDALSAQADQPIAAAPVPSTLTSEAHEDVSDSTGSVGQPRPGPPATSSTASPQPGSSMVRKPSGARSSLLRRELSRQETTGPDPNLTSVAPPTAASPADASPPLRRREREGRRAMRADRRMASADWRHRPAERRFPVTPSRGRWNEEIRGEARRRRLPVTVIYGTPPMRGRESAPVLIHVETSRAGGRVIRTTRIPLY